VRVLALRSLRSQNLQKLIAGCYLGLAYLALRAGPSPLAKTCLLAMGVVGVLAWTASLRRARTIAQLPTSRIASAAQGYVEVVGRAIVEPNHRVVSPMSGLQCIWYRYRLYEKDGERSGWTEIDEGVSSATFEINDGSGPCCIDPDYAEVVGAEVRTTYPSGNKLVEELLHGGIPIYVLGELITLGGAGTPLSAREDVNALLASWKADPVALQRRFDLNRDGQVDLQEWELARRLAQKTVEREHRELRAQPGVNLLRAPADGRLFLISSLSPQALRRRFVRWAVFHFICALAALGTWAYWTTLMARPL
jgi:hypothetical protein